MRLLARGRSRSRCPGPGAPHPVVASHLRVDARILVICNPSGYWRLHGRAERRLFVEEDQDGDDRPTYHVLNRSGRVVTVAGGQSDDDDEVVDAGLGRAGRVEVEPVLKTKRSSVLSFGDLYPVIRGHLLRADPAGLTPWGFEAIDVVEEDLDAPAAAYHVGEAAADAPSHQEVPGVGRLHGPDLLVVLGRVEHVQ